MVELKQKYKSLIEIQDFLCQQHDMYAVTRLTNQEDGNGIHGSITKTIRVSYGISPSTTPDMKSRLVDGSAGTEASKLVLDSGQAEKGGMGSGTWSILSESTFRLN